MSFKKNGGWSISGIDIPTTRIAAGTTVKMESVIYNSDEANELTETAQILEQARLLSCGLINSKAFRGMSDSSKKEGFTVAFMAVTDMTNAWMLGFLTPLATRLGAHSLQAEQQADLILR